MVAAIRVAFFVVGIISFSFGISVAIHVQHLGIHPWDVLNVGLHEKFGFSIGTWNIICGLTLIVISWLLDKSYIKLGTFLNAFMVGMFVDLFLWLDVIPQASHTWTDMFFMLAGIIIMGIGGGMYNAARLGSGPRDGFMLSMADKFNAPIGRVRIITESLVLLLGLILGGPVFIFTFIFTFIQSPIFQYTFLRINRYIEGLDSKQTEKNNVYKQRAK